MNHPEFPESSMMEASFHNLRLALRPRSLDTRTVFITGPSSTESASGLADSTLKASMFRRFVFSLPLTYNTITSPTKKSMLSNRPRKTSTKKQKRPFKHRKIPKALNGVASNIPPRIFNLLTSHLACMSLRSQAQRFC